MHALVLALLTLLALGAWAGFVYSQLRGQQRLWRAVFGPLSVELRRRAMLTRAREDSLAFPQPRECRTLTTRLAGLPVWSFHSTVGLPPEVDARIDSVAASEFDHLFSPRFRQHSAGQSFRTLFAV